MYWPIDGSAMTLEEWNNLISDLKLNIRSSGMTNQQIIKLIKDELKNYRPGNLAYDSMVDEANKLCDEVGPYEYNSILNCFEKLTNQALKEIGLNLPSSLLSNSFDLLPNCSKKFKNKNQNTTINSFEDFCKNSTLKSLDKDVALLCLEKIN